MISTLPSEILLLIASHLTNFADTLRLASCCQQFHALLTPQAYTIIELEDGRLWHISRLTHTLARNPQLAKAVRILRFGDKAIFCEHYEDILYYDDNIIRPLLEAATSSSKQLAAWEKQLKANSREDPWIAILLPLLENLEELKMVIHWPSTYTRRMLQSITQDPNNTALNRLKEVSVKWWDTEGGLPTSYVYPFFRLPFLSEFTGTMLTDGCYEDEDLYRDDFDNEEKEEYEDEEAKEARYPGAECFSNVTRLHLHYSNSEMGLPDLISASKQLESFVYKYNGSTGEYTPFNPQAFYRSLCKHKKSLTEITLCEEVWGYSVDDPINTQFIGSFKNFTALKKLRLRGQNILDWEESHGAGSKNTLPDVLPASLESLIIESFNECDSSGLTAQLETLIRNINSYCPNLAVLEIKGGIHELAPWAAGQKQTWPPPVPQLAGRFIEMTACLASLCREKGIQFRLWSPVMEERIKQYEYWLERQTQKRSDRTG